jgi:hypothetical protein
MEISLPLSDSIEALRGAFRVRMMEPNVHKPAHVEALRNINIQSAEEGQLDFESSTPIPMGDEALFGWAQKEYGNFKFIQRLLYSGDRVIGEVHDYADSHVGDVNNALETAGESLRIDPNKHIETCSFILKHTRDRDKMDEYAGLLQLVEIFGLDAQPGATVQDIQTAAMYMDGAEPSDRAMAHRIGYTISVEDIPYENELVATGFIATRDSVEQAVRVYAANLGIHASPAGTHSK